MDTPSQNRISFVLPWTGAWPRWIDLFLVSCEHNPVITWQLFCDSPPPRAVPKNVRVHEIGLDGIRALIREKTGFKTSGINGYKFCDLRPAYGKVFEDYLADFDFFGYCDCDVIWGSFDAQFEEKWLDTYDVISAQRMSICGQMTIIRNTDPFRNIYREILEYDNRLANPKPQGLDEIPMDDALRAQEEFGRVKVLRRQMQFQDETYEPWYRKACEIEMKEKGHLRDLNWKSGPVRWVDGRLFHIESQTENLFFHFMHWKSRWTLPDIRYDRRYLKGWEIRPSGFRLIYDSHASPLRLLFQIGFESRRLGQLFYGLICRVLNSLMIPRAYRYVWRRIKGNG